MEPVWYAQRAECCKNILKQYTWKSLCMVCWTSHPLCWQFNRSIYPVHRHVHTFSCHTQILFPQSFGEAFLQNPVLQKALNAYGHVGWLLRKPFLYLFLWLDWHFQSSLCSKQQSVLCTPACWWGCTAAGEAGRINKLVGKKNSLASLEASAERRMKSKVHSILSNISHLLCGGLRATDHLQPLPQHHVVLDSVPQLILCNSKLLL